MLLSDENRLFPWITLFRSWQIKFRDFTIIMVWNINLLSVTLPIIHIRCICMTYSGHCIHLRVKVINWEKLYKILHICVGCKVLISILDFLIPLFPNLFLIVLCHLYHMYQINCSFSSNALRAVCYCTFFSFFSYVLVT